MDNKYYEVMKRAVELSETVLEAMRQINTKLNEGSYQQAIPLLEDVMKACLSIDSAVQPIMPNLEPNELESLSEKLRNGFDLVVTAFEQGVPAKAQEIMQFNLMPSYKKWHAEINRVLKPHILS
ncbi:MAG: hypothetical protein H0Z40_11900 [Desulfotomaculum sp.]|nr:hypothetical protein [Desulfotomaculum sp.]